jgi:hypothetical protein
MKHALTRENTRQAGAPAGCPVDFARPGETAAVPHGCPSALFDHVTAVNTTQEAGR